MVACVGARMVKGGLLESELMVIEPGASGGVDRRLAGWAQFYGIDRFPSHAEAAKECAEVVAQKRQSRYHCIQSLCQAPDAASYLDGLVYKRRIRATVEPFLVYASQLGEEHRASTGHGAHVRAKGLGLGAWWKTPVQEVLMKEVYSEVMAERQLLGIDVLEFAFFPSKDVPAGSGRIEVRASSCSFAEPVGEHLLVAMYA